MMKPVFAITGRLLAGNIVSYIITAAIVIFAVSSGDIVISNGNYTWLLALLSPFFFVFHDFMKLIHIGACKKDYFISSLLSYGILASLISLLNALIHTVIDPLYGTKSVINLMDVCGWTDNGIIIAFLQQAFFLMLVMTFLHVLLSMQTKWYGWLTDIMLIAVICIFTPFAPLRSLLAGFFRIIMINSNALMQIFVSVFLTILLSLTGVLILKKRTL